MQHKGALKSECESPSNLDPKTEHAYLVAMATSHFDYIIVGSGFGGSVSALRLSEKGYRVLVIEKGKRFNLGDFPKTNWNLRKWLWMPQAGMHGFFQMSFFKHLTIFSGVGVGGGSLTYANTLPVPKKEFFTSGSWAGVRDWEAELAPHYKTAKRMLGAAEVKTRTYGDDTLLQIAKDMGRESHWGPTEVGVFFGEPGRTVADPYFDGQGPARTGCTHCGACMTGCRVGAKNTLDRNYLYLAEGLGAQILPETTVTAVRPRDPSGYTVETRGSFGLGRVKRKKFTADRVVFSGGVLGTIDLLLKMKDDPRGLPRLSERLGTMIRTNSESLLSVVTDRRDLDFSKGVAITSILHTDDHSHVEPVRYGEGSDFFHLMMAPHAPGDTLPQRLARTIDAFRKNPTKLLRAATVPGVAKYSQILLYMRSLEGTLTFERKRDIRRGFKTGLTSELEPGAEPPAAFIPEATDIAERFAEKVDGTAVGLITETMMGIPTTAHILGGACIGRSAQDGVIDHKHEVFGYPGLFVIDGAAVSANPGVNPSLSITAMAERAMTFVEPRSGSTA